MREMHLLLLVVLCLVSCQEGEKKQIETSEAIVLYFSNYNPKPYKTPGGAVHIKLPQVSYIDNNGNLVDFTPENELDTLIIYVPDSLKELALSYRNFEYIYYTLIQGDTITISIDSLDYPLLSSKYHSERDRIYNINHELRKGHTHLNLEAKTCLGSDWVGIAQNIDYYRLKKWTIFLADYCPLDSLHAMFNSYKKAYSDTIDNYKQSRLISNEAYNRYKFHLLLKEHESKRILNQDTSYYHQMESEIKDEYVYYPSYHEYLNYYLWYFNEHLKMIQEVQGYYRDWRQTFDEISKKTFQPKSKQILLERCIKEIGERFPTKDTKQYLDSYLKITRDTLLYSNIRDQYNLDANANQLLLKDIYGKSTNLEHLLNKYKGKVIYVDFWASWCVPCREEMIPSAKLREQYKGKDIIFLYLAYNDTENSWKKAIKKEGLHGIDTNYFITNSKNSKVLEKIKLELIPRVFN